MLKGICALLPWGRKEGGPLTVQLSGTPERTQTRGSQLRLADVLAICSCRDRYTGAG